MKLREKMEVTRGVKSILSSSISQITQEEITEYLDLFYFV